MTLSMRIPMAVLAAMSLLLVACPGDDEDCLPQTCADLGFECGTQDDGCGGTIDCGTCDSPPAAQCDNNTAVNYQAAGTCTAGACEYTPSEEACGTQDCAVVAGVAVCQAPPATCDINGFNAVETTGYADAELLEVAAVNSAAPPGEELYVEWWFNYGAEFTGPGSYPVEQNTNYNDCGFCLLIIRYDAAGEATQMFFATEGVVEVTAIGGDGEPFTGVLNDVVFNEWSQEDTMVPGGEVWCVDGFTWNTNLEGTLP